METRRRRSEIRVTPKKRTKCDPIQEALRNITPIGVYVCDCSHKNSFIPKRIIINGIATIVFWEDGTKSVVKCAEGDEKNVYDAFNAALAIKVFGSNSKLKKTINSLVEDKGKKDE